MNNTWPGWKMECLLGEGSYGKVYKITREEFGTTYQAALKVITIPQSDSDVNAAYEEGMDEKSVTEYFRSFVEDIVSEFALMSKLKGNSHIVSYEDHMVIQHEDGIGWDILIRMELLTSLNEYMRKKPLQELDVIRLGLHIAQALEMCERRGILHRDIKPENIFVSEDGDFKLGDFGVARIAEKTISVMSRKGTYSYMAPEVYRGEKYGCNADLYSLGIMLYRFMNDNRLPFLPPYPQDIRYSDREQALNDRVSGKEIPVPAHGSESFQKVILKCISYNPDDRYATAADLTMALQQLAGKGGEETICTKTEVPLIPAGDFEEEKTVSVLEQSRVALDPPKRKRNSLIADWVLFVLGLSFCLIWPALIFGLLAGPVCLAAFYIRRYKLNVMDWILLVFGILFILLWSVMIVGLLAGFGLLIWLFVRCQRRGMKECGREQVKNR